MPLKLFPDKPFERDPQNLPKWDRSNNYICQQKVDGWRMIIIIGEDDVEFVSRHDKVFTQDIQPSLREEARKLCALFPPMTQLDSEWLARRSCSVSKKIKGKVPAKLILFDILRLGKRWQKSVPYADRWDALKAHLQDVDFDNIELSLEAEPGQFATFYEAQKEIAVSEGVVIKHKRSKMTGSRNGCKKNPQWFKVKYRGGSDGEMSMDHLHR